MPEYQIDSGIETAIELLGQDEYFALVMQVVQALLHLQRYDEASDIIDAVLHSSRLKDEATIHRFRCISIEVAYHSSDYVTAYDAVRDMCIQQPHSLQIWDLFNRIITKMGEFSAHTKFMIRLLNRHPTSLPLMVLVGHHCLMSGFYNLALAEYLKAYHILPSDPILNLTIGLTLLHQTMSRRVNDRNLSVLQAFAFLFRYMSLRNRNQESHYNLARAFQQLGLMQFAVPYYEKVLIMDPPPGSDPESCDLKAEAAYNLSLIYRASGNTHLAIQLLRDFCTI